jgi:hypothetical protein
MIQVRMTRRLLDGMGIRAEASAVNSGAALGNWYADHAPVRSGALVVALNVETLLAVVVPAQPVETFGHALWWRLLRLLTRYGAAPGFVAHVAEGFDAYSYTVTASRSMRNHLVEARRLVEVWSQEWGAGEDIPYEEVENTLAEWLYGPAPYRSPSDLLRAALEAWSDGAGDGA